MTYGHIADILGRTKASVRMMVIKLKLRKYPAPPETPPTKLYMPRVWRETHIRKDPRPLSGLPKQSSGIAALASLMPIMSE